MSCTAVAHYPKSRNQCQYCLRITTLIFPQFFLWVHLVYLSYSQIFYIVEYTNLGQNYKKATLTNQTCIENLLSTLNL